MVTAQTSERTARILSAVTAAFGVTISLIVVGFAAQVQLRLGFAIFNEQGLALVLGLALAIVFIRFSVGGRNKPKPTVPLYDIVFAAAGFGMSLWVMVRYPVLSAEFFFHKGETFAIGIVLIPLIIEALRRTAGWALVTILVSFLLYGLLGHLVPGNLEGRSMAFTRLVSYLGIDNVALFGLPLTIIVLTVVMFILMGQFLLRTGGSEWFTELAMAVMGRTRGGAAKIAVVASALFGSISGSAVSNVASTGVITIPLMRQAGYSRRSAAAFEAVASTGGQVMPPIMGAAAFLMAELLEVAYTEIVLAALLPAILSYIAVFIQADVEAAAKNIEPLPEDQIVPLGRVLKEGWFFVTPFVLLVFLLFRLNLNPAEAAFWASILLVALNFFIGYKGRRLNFKELMGLSNISSEDGHRFGNAGTLLFARVKDTAEVVLSSLKGAGETAVEIVVIGAMAGMIIGIVEVTGLGFGLTFVLVQIGEGGLFGLLVLTAIVSIILGMGMPTTAIYLLVATLAAPPLIRLGVDPISAHMFVLYYGLLSMITPPVAIAAFTAANLAGSKPMATALTAVRYGWPAFVLPFLFVLSPSLLLQGPIADVILAVVTAVAGVWLASIAVGGFFRQPLNMASRAAFGAAGFALLVPADSFDGGLWVQVAGVGVAALVIWREYAFGRKRETV